MTVLDPRPMAVEHLLHEQVQRALRLPAGRMAMVLHLSRLPPPAPRPHHLRIASALMKDSAERHEGQVYALRNGDLVLLCRVANPGGRGLAVADPNDLPATLARLMQIDAPDPAQLLSLWHLARDAAPLLAYVAARLGESSGRVEVAEDFAGQTGTVDAIGAMIGTAAIGDLLQQQTAIVLHGEGMRRSGIMRPLYREVAFSIPALEARAALQGFAGADPFLFRHLAARLDQRMLLALADARGQGGPLDVAAVSHGTDAPPMLHLNLTVSGILSPAFARFAAACRDAGAPAGIEISLLEACGEPTGFALARQLVAASGLGLVLDGVSHLALLVSRPWALRPDLFKLDWSPRLTSLRAAEAVVIADAIAQCGPERIVLHRAETEAAIRWGRAHGISRFQGRHVDAMLGAGRIVACTHAARCTLRQCIERSAATGRAGRAGCTNTGLLDAAAPDPARQLVP